MRGYFSLFVLVLLDLVGIVYSAVQFSRHHDDGSGEGLIFTVLMLPLVVAIWFVADRSAKNKT